jgi:protease-4
MKRHPLLVGLLLFTGAALVFFAAVFISTALFGDFGPISNAKVALIRIEGVILDSRDTIDELREYKDSPGVRAIVLRIDSPGGGVVPSQEIFEEVQKIRTDGRQKIVASMGSVAASGGYYIAAATDRIVANPGTITGSIGVIMETANVKGLLDKIGVEPIVIKAGEHKDIGSPFRKLEPDDRRILEELLNDVHTQFIEAVARGRNLPAERVRELADGRIFTGRQAKDFGLVDDLGNLQDTIQAAAELAGIEGEPRVIERREGISFFDMIRNELRGLVPGVRVPEVGIALKYLMTL